LGACGSPYAAASRPANLAGLNWVLHDAVQRAQNASAAFQPLPLNGRAVHERCTLDYEGASVCLDWSQFGSVHAGRHDYDKVGEPSVQPLVGGKGSLLVWGPEDISGLLGCNDLPYKSAAMVKGQLWGVAAYASSPSVASDARRYFGDFRPLRQWSGVATR
jgi:hypothetical protein